MGVLKPDLIFKSIVPIIMAGILGIYGLIVAVILNNKGKELTKGPSECQSALDYPDSPPVAHVFIPYSEHHWCPKLRVQVR